jgi:hypothetical protein
MWRSERNDSRFSNLVAAAVLQEREIISSGDGSVLGAVDVEEAL